MPTTIVVGGQYGSEGKGKVVALCASSLEKPWVVRCGGPNSGHTIQVQGNEIVLRQVPAGAGHPQALLLLSAGCAVDEDLLVDELNRLDLPRERIIVDPRAVLISDAHRKAEEAAVGLIGSTGSGTGAALVHRMTRSGDVRLVKDSMKLVNRVRVETVAPLLHAHLKRGGDVLIEGTQGFGLSLLHGQHYPFVTSRDTTAGGFAMEVGLSPRQVDEIILVIRTFPIRVGGPSGPLADELTWEAIQSESGAPQVELEYTSVTRRLRRVARFDLEAVRDACMYNCPTAIALMGLDRLDYRNRRIAAYDELTHGAKLFIDQLQLRTGINIKLLGTGFATWDAIRL